MLEPLAAGVALLGAALREDRAHQQAQRMADHLLIGGVPPYCEWGSASGGGGDHIEAFIGQLTGLNEQLSLLLRLKDIPFAEHWLEGSFQESLVLYLESFFLSLVPAFGESLQAAPPKEAVADWQVAYVCALQSELASRSVRLSQRCLTVFAPPLLRAMDLPLWYGAACKMLSMCPASCGEGEEAASQMDAMLFGLYETLFSVGSLMAKHLAVVLDSLSQEHAPALGGADRQPFEVAALALLWGASSIPSGLLQLLLAATEDGSRARSERALAFLARRALFWSSTDVASLAASLIGTRGASKQALQRLCDLLTLPTASSPPQLAAMVPFGRALKEELAIHGDVEELYREAPSKFADREGARRLLLKHRRQRPPKEALAAALADVGVDEYTRLVDDKSFVRQFKESILNGGASSDDSEDFDAHADDDHVGSLDVSPEEEETTRREVRAKDADIRTRKASPAYFGGARAAMLTLAMALAAL